MWSYSQNASSAAQQGTVRAVVASKADPGKESVELPGKNLTRGPMVSMHAKVGSRRSTCEDESAVCDTEYNT